MTAQPAHPRVKSYRAASLSEALALVRSELGPDAAVLDTRRREDEHATGQPGGYEILASADIVAASRLHPDAIAARRPASHAGIATDGVVPAHLEQDYRARFRSELKSQLHDLRSTVEDLSRRVPDDARPRAVADLIAALVASGVDETAAWELAEKVEREASPEELGDPRRLHKRAIDVVAREISVARETPVAPEILVAGPIDDPNADAPGRPKVVALVGPTGVGKTTAVAKLAARLKIHHARRVGLVTADTRRVAAVEQLAAYADLIDLPLELAGTADAMQSALRRLDGCDVVLIDTAGTGARDSSERAMLRAILRHAGADEVLLVISATSGGRQMLDVAESFAPLGTTSLLLTKLDEVGRLGHLLSLTSGSRLPLRYVSRGPRVPDDLETPDAARLAEAIVGPAPGTN